MAKTTRTPLISGNWKMHHNHFEAIQTVQKLAYLLHKEDTDTVDVYPADGRRTGPGLAHQAGAEGLLVHDHVLYVANRNSGTVDAYSAVTLEHLRVAARIPEVRRLAWAGGRTGPSWGGCSGPTGYGPSRR